MEFFESNPGLLGKFIRLFCHQSGLLLGDSGVVKSTAKIRFILKQCAQLHTKVEILGQNNLEFGLMQDVQSHELLIYKFNAGLSSTAYEFYFSNTEYLFRFKGYLRLSAKNIYLVTLPDSISYKKRELRADIEVDDGGSNQLYVAFDRKSQQYYIGDLLDISMRGLGFVPNSIFFDHNLTVGDKLFRLLFRLGCKSEDVQIDNAFVRNIHQIKCGLEFASAIGNAGKHINDYILSWLHSKNKVATSAALGKSGCGFRRGGIHEPTSTSSPTLAAVSSRSAADQTRLNRKEMCIYVVETIADVYSLIRDVYMTQYFSNPAVAKINCLRKVPHLIVMELLTAANHDIFRHWLSLINTIREKRIPSVLLLDQPPADETGVIKLIKTFGMKDLIIKKQIRDSEEWVSRLDALLFPSGGL